MLSISVLIISLLIGILLQKVKNIPADAPTTLGALILFVPLPAVCLLTLPDIEWELSLISLVLVAWIVFGVAYFIFNYLGKKFSWDKGLIGCLILTAGFCNSSFVGFPIISALYGSDALKHAVLLDQAGSFLIVSSFGIWVAITYSTGKIRKRILFKKILLFPPFIAFMAGLIMSLLGLRFEGMSREVLQKFTGLLTPLALFTVGLQLHWKQIRQDFKFLVIGLSYKLIFAPMLILGIYLLIGIDKKLLEVSVMEAAMAPMITSSILAASHQLHSRLAGMMVGVGVPLSFLTLGMWYFLLKLV